MRKFLAFFRRFRIFLVFLVLQIIALSFYFSAMGYQRTVFFNSSSSLIGTLLTWEREVIKYFYLDDANKKLQEENIALQNKISKNFISIDPKTAIINDTIKKLSYERIPAIVINSSHTFTNNYFTINAGTEKGISPKMGVVSSDGVVGIVYDVSKHFAIVKSILTNNINISAYVSNSGAFGLIKYNGDNPMRVSLSGISNDIALKRGSWVNSRGSSGYFPQGIPIGTIEDFSPVEGKPMWDVTVLLSQDMRRLRNVYVIKNIHQAELNNLEKNIMQLQ